MVARNLERGSGFLRPQVETAPVPNLFLVEPPIYAAAVVGFRKATGLPLEPAGRLVSALAMTLAAWGLYGLVRRREGVEVALLAVAAFAAFPLTLRYGRAFQPDALMLGTLLAGLRSWDEHEVSGRTAWLVLGWTLLATGLALKVVSAYLVLPLLAMSRQPPGRAKLLGILGLMVPALLWYAHAAALIQRGEGSRAAADNGALWLRVLIPTALWRIETLRLAGRFLAVRAFTPLGLVLALGGLFGAGRIWRVWALAASGALVVLVAKLHHEYYYLALAPPAALGVGRALALLGRNRPMLAGGAGLAFLGLCGLQARTTWQTPPEWVGLAEAAAAVQRVVPPGALVVAPEALCYAADRRGCRLELTPAAAQRAAGEWGAVLQCPSPPDLVEFYKARGARFVALPGRSAGPHAPESARLALQEAIRRRYNVLVDRPLVLIATLDHVEAKGSPDAHRKQD
jgi:4-amino-4-deoxy-L-arabinose transferase-like glycosyltransferase